MKRTLLTIAFVSLFLASVKNVYAIPSVIGRVVTPDGTPIDIDPANPLKLEWRKDNFASRYIPDSGGTGAEWRTGKIAGYPQVTNKWYYYFPPYPGFDCATLDNVINLLSTSGYNCAATTSQHFQFSNTPEYLVIPDIVCTPNSVPIPTPALPTPTPQPVIASGEPPFFDCTTVGMTKLTDFGSKLLDNRSSNVNTGSIIGSFLVPAGFDPVGTMYVYQGEGHNWDLGCNKGPNNDSGRVGCDQLENGELAFAYVNGIKVGNIVDHNPDDDREFLYGLRITNLSEGSNTYNVNMWSEPKSDLFVKGTICGKLKGAVLPTPIGPTPVLSNCDPVLTLNPSSSSVEVGSQQTVTATVTNTYNCGTLTTGFTNSNPAVASMTPTGSQAVFTGLVSGTTQITSTIYSNGVPVETQTGNLTVACTPPNSPTNFSAVDDVFKIKTTWRDNSTVETGYELKKDGVVIANLPANTITYTDGPASGVCTGAHSYELTAVNALKPVACQRSSTVSAIGKCEDYKAWFGVQDGGVAASSGEVRSDLPSWAGPVAYGSFPPTFVSDSSAPSLLPGMVFGPSFSGFDATQANNQQWLVSGYTGWTETTTKRENTFTSMEDRILARVNPEAVGTTTFTSQGGLDSLIGQSADNLLNLPGTQVQVIQIAGDLIFDTDIDVGPKKLLIFVEGNVQINHNITVGSGGFLAVLASGNTTISPTVGDSGTTVDASTGYTLNMTTDPRLATYPAHIEGIFFADGVIDTGGRDNSLSPQRHRFIKIEGSLIGMTNVSLKRDVRGPYPAEYVKFRPDFSYILHQIGLRRKTFQEMLAP